MDVLGIPENDKFLKPKKVEITAVEAAPDEFDEAEGAYRITLTYDRYDGSAKTIFEFGPEPQNIQVRLDIHYGESDKHDVILRNAVGSVVEYHDVGPVTVELIFKSDQKLCLHAIGVAKVSKIECWVAQRTWWLNTARAFRRLKQSAGQITAYIKTNGVGICLLRPAYWEGKAIIDTPQKLLDPFQQVFGYSSQWIGQSPIQKIALGCSDAGNFFMQEIADLIASGLVEMGLSVHQFGQRNLPDAAAYDLVIIIAPHEFFTLNCSEGALTHLRKSPRLYMFNTEQAQTSWFAAALGYLKSADKILDINYQTALRLSMNGLNARFFPLGYSQTYYTKYKSTSLSRSGPMAGLPEAIVNCAAEKFSERPIDILFVGTESVRRKNFFAQNAAYFSDKECFIYMPAGSDPFFPGAPATIGFQDLLGLARRSKVILNIHRDADQYLEWQRIVNIGLFSGAIVVSETCDSNPILKPEYHYIDTPLCRMLQTLDHILSNVDFFSQTIDAGRSQLVKSMPISRTLKLLFWES